jgi:hypothetical protein
MTLSGQSRSEVRPFFSLTGTRRDHYTVSYFLRRSTTVVSALLVLGLASLWTRSTSVKEMWTCTLQRGETASWYDDTYCRVWSWSGHFAIEIDRPRGPLKSRSYELEIADSRQAATVRFSHSSALPEYFFSSQRSGIGFYDVPPVRGTLLRVSSTSGISAPYWLLILAAGLPGAWVGSRHLARARRAMRRHTCRRCGYDLRATPDRCPECGSVTPEEEKGGKKGGHPGLNITR